jgi:hypothetical protein
MINLSQKFLTVNGKRASVSICADPWVDGVPRELIKLRSRKGAFPAEFREAFKVESNSDIMTDYFEADTIRLMPNHPLYAKAKSLA